MVHEGLQQYESTITRNELKDLEKEIKMNSAEWRIYVTNLIANAWEELVENEKDRSIINSWHGTGLNLRVDGTNDNAWLQKMVQKYEGSIIREEDIADQILESAYNTRGYQKLRAVTKIMNKGSSTALPPFKHPEDEDYDSDQDKWIKGIFENEENDDTSDEEDYKKDNDNNNNKTKKKGKKKRLSQSLFQLCDQEYHIPTKTKDDSERLPHYGKKKNTNNEQKINDNDDNSDQDDDDDDDSDDNNSNDGDDNHSLGHKNKDGSKHNTSNDQDDNDSDDNNSDGGDDDNDDDNNNKMMIKYVGLVNPNLTQCYQLSWIQSMALINPHIIKSLNIINNLKYNTDFNEEDSEKISVTEWTEIKNMFNHLRKIIIHIIHPELLTFNDVYELNLQEQRAVINPIKFCKSVPSPFCNKDQEDVQEFYSCIFDQMKLLKANSIKQPKRTMINTAFKFVEQINTKCLICNHSRVKLEPQTTLSVCNILLLRL